MNNKKSNTGGRRKLLKGKQGRKTEVVQSVLEWIIAPCAAQFAGRTAEGSIGQRVELPVIRF